MEMRRYNVPVTPLIADQQLFRRWAAQESAAGPVNSNKDKKVTIERSLAKYVSFFPLILAGLFLTPRARAQSLNKDGQSAIVFQQWAEVIPSPQTGSVGL